MPPSSRVDGELRVGLVVPVFNESQRWDEDLWRDYIENLDVAWLFVDDGSTDESGRLIENLNHNYAQVRALCLPSNQGKAEAVRAGMLELLEQGDVQVVGFLDADGAFAVSDVSTLVDQSRYEFQSDSVDAVWSARVALAGHDIQRTTSRHFVGRGVATLLGMAIKPMPYDTQSGFKLFAATPELLRCLRKPFATRWLFDVEFILRWQEVAERPLRILEIPVKSWHDVRGSKIRGREKVRIAKEITRILRESRRING